MPATQRLGNFQLPKGQTVAFWRYIDNDTVAIVTNTSVLHWKIIQNQPRKVCDRHKSLRDCIIMSYEVSGDGKWLLVGGIKKGAGGGMVGKMQLYSVEKSVSQSLNGNAGVFAEIALPGRAAKAQVFCFVEKKPAASLSKVIGWWVGGLVGGWVGVWVAELVRGRWVWLGRRVDVCG